MSNWKRIAFLLVGVVAVVAVMGVWRLPQVRAALLGPGESTPAVALQGQSQDQKPWIGISLLNNGPRVKERLQLTTDQGVVISSVVKDSPGAKAGLLQRDIITALDGAPVKTAQDVTKAVLAKKVGDQVTLTILRNGQESKVTVSLEAAPERPKPLAGPAPFGALGGILGARQNLRSAKVEVTDKDGKTRTIEVVAGTVQSSSSSSISVLPNGDTTARSFQVASDTRFAFGGKAEDLKAADQVLVVAEGGKALQVSGGSLAPRGPKGMPFHRFGPWGQPQPPAGALAPPGGRFPGALPFHRFGPRGQPQPSAGTESGYYQAQPSAGTGSSY